MARRWPSVSSGRHGGTSRRHAVTTFRHAAVTRKSSRLWSLKTQPETYFLQEGSAFWMLYNLLKQCHQLRTRRSNTKLQKGTQHSPSRLMIITFSLSRLSHPSLLPSVSAICVTYHTNSNTQALLVWSRCSLRLSYRCTPFSQVLSGVVVDVLVVLSLIPGGQSPSLDGSTELDLLHVC